MEAVRPDPDSLLARAAAILDDFAASSGLTGAAQPRRYLWTDAFAVLTWIGLHERTGKRRFLDLAQRLVVQAHDVLGAHRDDDAHPTARGLRIGKRLSEREPFEPYDSELEWERDGQYYHYLTKWMVALERIGGATRDERYRRWAVELARAAHRAFAYPEGAPRRMYWKMSVDLTRPLVASMGAHDPLDGLVTMTSLGLETEARELARVCEGVRWATPDALGAGGLLLDALRLARLVARGRKDLRGLFAEVLQDAAASAPAAAATIRGPASQRLAFRELGFALGLHAVEPLGRYADTARLAPYVPLARELEDFWLDPASQLSPTWTGHRDINAVSLAASLAPDGMLGEVQRAT
jgi:hypothetical protein